jgi:hypothetical protein
MTTPSSTHIKKVELVLGLPELLVDSRKSKVPVPTDIVFCRSSDDIALASPKA